MNQILRWLLGADPAELAGKGDWHFGFVAEHSNYLTLALIAVFLAMVYLIVRSYRREGDNPRGVKVFLAALRVLVCVLVLLVIFRPAIVLRFARTLYSTVVVLIDDSRSMSFTDRYADAKVGDALAGELGVSAAELERKTRSEVLQTLLAAPGGVLDKLARDHPVVLMRFSTDQPGRYTRELGRLGGQEDANAASSPPGSPPAIRPADLKAMLASLTANGHETNLAVALRDAIEEVLGRRVAGIVLMSDGQVTARDARGRLADELTYAAQRGLRLYSVMVGDPTPPKNVSVTGLQAPREVRRGARTELSVSLAHRNLTGQSVTVRLQRRPRDQTDWADTGIAKDVALDGNALTGGAAGGAGEAARGVQTVDLPVEPNQIGHFMYRAYVEPRPDERNTEDNHADAPVQVTDEKIKVLLVSGDAGWEFQYLRNYFIRQPELYRVSVWQQNADKEVNQAASTGMKLEKLPRLLEELAGSPGGKPQPGYDVIVLYDPQPTVDGFDGEFVKNLRKFVEVHGGGLCYIAGNKYYAHVVRAQGPYDDLTTMLPVSPGRRASDIVERIGARPPEAWPLRLTSYGTEHPVMRLAGSAEESQRIWRALPGIYWSHPVLRIKPLTRVLAESTNLLHRTDRNEAEPVVASRVFGTGRVLYMGTDETWRWRYIRDGYYHGIFWGNVIGYLATLQARNVLITAGGDLFSLGEQITVEAEVYDENYNPLKAAAFDVDMTDVKTGQTKTLTLEAVANKPGRFKATFRATETGVFELTALKGDPLAKEKVQPKTIRIEPPKAEAARTEADRATLESIASRTENFVGIHQVGRLAELIPADRKTAVRQVPRELWNSNLTLLLIVLLLTVEWIVRKKYNMA